MLLRTRSKCRVALVVRTILLCGVPFAYYMLAPGAAEDPYTGRRLAAEHESYKSRNILGFPVTKNGQNCTPPAILEFPSDGFTREQRKQGFVAIHAILALYCFTLLAIVCDDYFVPAIRIICTKLQMAEDVAGATFMAAASSSPELFITCVGTFVTEGDLGVGTVVGSAVFNVLAVPACCGLFAAKVVELDWWSVSRDSLMYGVAVVALICTLQDDRVMWYEALILVAAYALYILAMCFNTRLSGFLKSGCCGGGSSKEYTEVTPLIAQEKKHPLDATAAQSEHAVQLTEEFDLEESVDSLWSWPREGGWSRTYRLGTWPLHALLWVSVPDCRRRPRLVVLTFFMCVLWIGFVSYFVAWLITIIGDTLNIPDSVMGLTFLAAGTSVPEAVSSIIVTNQGHGAMGISNSIGSNTFDILLCLGLPWLIKSLVNPTTPGENWVNINSSGIAYSAVSLLSTLVGLYTSFALNKFRLDWKIGLACSIMYAAFLALATLIETNVFFTVNLPTCAH